LLQFGAKHRVTKF